MDEQFELIMCIINQGFAENVMDAARQCGATGGTILNARGSVREEAEALFNISISPQKEVVFILIPSDKKEDILHAIYQKCGLNTPGQGIAFSIPVDDVVGLKKKTIEI